MLQSKEFNLETLTLWQSTSNDMLRNKSFTVEITGKLAHQSPQRNMQKLLDCIRPLLKRILACLTFHRKEIRLRHLHKRTNPGSAPQSISTTTHHHPPQPTTSQNISNTTHHHHQLPKYIHHHQPQSKIYPSKKRFYKKNIKIFIQK